MKYCLPSIVTTSAWTDLITFPNERHRDLFKEMRHRIDVVPGPGSAWEYGLTKEPEVDRAGW